MKKCSPSIKVQDKHKMFNRKLFEKKPIKKRKKCFYITHEQTFLIELVQFKATIFDFIDKH